MNNKYNFRSVIWIYIVTFLVALFMIWLKFISVYSPNLIENLNIPTTGIWFGFYWGLVVIFLLVTLKGFMILTHLGYNYRIEKDGIIATLFYKQTKFKFSEIQSFYKLDSSQAGDLVYRLNNNLLDVKSMINLPAGFNLLLNLTYLGKYSGIPIKTAQTSASISVGKSKMLFPVYIRALKINQTKGDYILLMMKNGRMYFLTPENADAFYKELSSKAK